VRREGQEWSVVTRESYREAMARLGAAVNVITTDGPAGKRGFTASAVCSVTDDPPTLLVCCHRFNDSHAALVGNRVMCINTLGATQQHISNVFAGLTGQEGESRFDAASWYTLETGAPALHGAVVSFDTRVAQLTEIGTHTVLFGEVLAIRHGFERDALIYFARAYHPVTHPIAS
jgi:flavin reductase